MRGAAPPRRGGRRGGDRRPGATGRESVSPPARALPLSLLSPLSFAGAGAAFWEGARIAASRPHRPRQASLALLAPARCGRSVRAPGVGRERGAVRQRRGSALALCVRPAAARAGGHPPPARPPSPPAARPHNALRRACAGMPPACARASNHAKARPHPPAPRACGTKKGNTKKNSPVATRRPATRGATAPAGRVEGPTAEARMVMADMSFGTGGAVVRGARGGERENKGVGRRSRAGERRERTGAVSFF